MLTVTKSEQYIQKLLLHTCSRMFARLCLSTPFGQLGLFANPFNHGSIQDGKSEISPKTLGVLSEFSCLEDLLFFFLDANGLTEA